MKLSKLSLTQSSSLASAICCVKKVIKHYNNYALLLKKHYSVVSIVGNHFADPTEKKPAPVFHLGLSTPHNPCVALIITDCYNSHKHKFFFATAEPLIEQFEKVTIVLTTANVTYSSLYVQHKLT